MFQGGKIIREGQVTLLRCPDDLGELRADTAPVEALHCTTCGLRYIVTEGIVQLMQDQIHPETEHERTIRDREACAHGGPADGSDQGMAVEATAAALDVRQEHGVLELGAGTGRFTKILAAHARYVVAIDISKESLIVAAEGTGHPANLTLVHADATRRVVAERAFDRVLGTLASNLPDRESRERSYAVAAEALRDDGRFVFTTHHFGLRARIAHDPKEGRYSENGIYRRLLEPSEVRAELSPYFERIAIQGANVIPPFALRAGFSARAVDRIFRRVPGFRAFADLLLVTATHPRR